MLVETLIPLSPTRLRRLHRETHLHLMNLIVRNLKTYVTRDADYLAHVRELEGAVEVEQEFFVRPRGSEFSERISQADHARVCLFRAFRRCVSAYAMTPNLPEYQYAQALVRVIRPYKLDLKSTFRQRSGDFVSLFNRLLSDENRPAVAKLHLVHMVEQMHALTYEAIGMLDARNAEAANRVPEGLSKACAHTDRVCVKCLRFVSSMHVYLKDEALGRIIACINEEIKGVIAESKGRKRRVKEETVGNVESTETRANDVAGNQTNVRVWPLQLVYPDNSHLDAGMPAAQAGK